MPQTLADIVLTADERDALETLARAGRGRADLARRARIVLRLAAGDSYGAIARGLGESTRTIGKWKRRFLEARVAGLEGRYRGNTPLVWLRVLPGRLLRRLCLCARLSYGPNYTYKADDGYAGASRPIQSD